MEIREEAVKDIRVPIEIFSIRNISALELLAYYLKHSLKLKQKEICYLLKRQPSTIATFASRAEKKIEMFKQIYPDSFHILEEKLRIENP